MTYLGLYSRGSVTREDALSMTYPELDASIKDMDAFLEAEAKVRKKAAEGR